MQNKTVAGIVLITAVASASLALYLRPPLTKTVEVSKDVLRTDIRTVIQHKESPNGTKETATTIIDNSQRTVQASKSTQIVTKRDWLVGASIATDFGSFQPVYGVLVNRRILGPVFAGLIANTQSELGLVVSFEF